VLVGAAWYAIQRRVGRPIEPDCGLSDQLHRAQYRSALMEKEPLVNGAPDRSWLVVELVEERPNEEVPRILTAVAKRFDIVVVSKVAPKLSLTGRARGDACRGRVSRGPPEAPSPGEPR